MRFSSSSQLGPFSLANILPGVSGSNVKSKLFRKPMAYREGTAPVWVKTGLLGGIEPSGLIRCILPFLTVTFWELAASALSPMDMYSLPSGPKWILPPLWLPAVWGEENMVVGLEPTPLFSTKRDTLLVTELEHEPLALKV